MERGVVGGAVAGEGSDPGGWGVGLRKLAEEGALLGWALLAGGEADGGAEWLSGFLRVAIAELGDVEGLGSGG